jgi:hypothetical protein
MKALKIRACHVCDWVNIQDLNLDIEFCELSSYPLDKCLYAYEVGRGSKCFQRSLVRI